MFNFTFPWIKRREARKAAEQKARQPGQLLGGAPENNGAPPSSWAPASAPSHLVAGGGTFDGGGASGDWGGSSCSSSGSDSSSSSSDSGSSCSSD